MIFAVVFVLISAAVTASADLSALASLDVSRVLSGELWRLLSGHTAHLTWRQYLVDAPAFAALYATYSRKSGSFSALALALLAALVVSIAVILSGNYQVYGGCSGLSCAALSAILLAAILEQPRQIAPYLVGFFYCLYLLFVGGAASGVQVAREAHLAGAVAGVIFVLLRARLLNRRAAPAAGAR